MMRNKGINVAIVGGGIIGQKVSELYNTRDKSKVVASYRRKKEQSIELAKKLEAKSYSEEGNGIDKMLKQKIDLVVASIIPGAQYDLAMKCAEKKNLYV